MRAQWRDIDQINRPRKTLLALDKNGLNAMIWGRQVFDFSTNMRATTGGGKRQQVKHDTRYAANNITIGINHWSPLMTAACIILLSSFNHLDSLLLFRVS